MHPFAITHDLIACSLEIAKIFIQGGIIDKMAILSSYELDEKTIPKFSIQQPKIHK